MCHILDPLFRQRGPKSIAERITQGFLAALFFGLPIVMWNGFFAVTEAKAAYFWITGTAYALLMLSARRRGTGFARRKLSAPESAFAVFCGVFLLSSLVCPNPLGAILGETNRYQGMLTVMLYLAMYLCVRRGGGLTALSFSLLVAAYVICALLGILNYFSVDPLGTLSYLSAFDRGRYLSTFGNINFFGSYIVLFLPAFLFLSCKCGERRIRALFLAVTALGCAAAMAARSESVVLGFGAAVLLLPLALFRTPDALRRMPLALALSLAAMAGMKLLNGLFGGPRFSALTEALLSPAALAAASAVLITLYAILRRVRDGAFHRIKRLCFFFYAALAALVLLSVVLCNTVLRDASLPGLARYLRFGEHWGTDRGGIWTFCIDTYRDFPLWQKLIGGGPGCILRADASYGMFADAQLDAAHNEYLHYLLTTGALGLIAYLAVLILTVWESLRCDESDISRALLLGAAAYIVQAAVNIAQPATAPLFFAVLAILHSRAKPAGETSLSAD